MFFIIVYYALVLIQDEDFFVLQETELQEKDLEERLRIVREKLKVETDERKRKELEEEEQRLLKLLRGSID